MRVFEVEEEGRQTESLTLTDQDILTLISNFPQLEELHLRFAPNALTPKLTEALNSWNFNNPQKLKTVSLGGQRWEKPNKGMGPFPGENLSFPTSDMLVQNEHLYVVKVTDPMIMENLTVIPLDPPADPLYGLDPRKVVQVDFDTKEGKRICAILEEGDIECRGPDSWKGKGARNIQKGDTGKRLHSPDA